MRWARDDAEFGRAIGFVDATFALALTLLVTTLEVGEGAAAWKSFGDLDDAVGNQFVAFAIAFTVISGYWLAHHRMIASFAGIDTPLIVANLCLVAAIVLLPFSTSAVGDPGVEDLPVPTTLMAINVAVASTLYAAVYTLAYRRGLLAPRPSRPEYIDYLLNSLAPAVVFLASIPIAFAVDPTVAQLTWLALIPIGAVLSRRSARREKAGAG